MRSNKIFDSENKLKIGAMVKNEDEPELVKKVKTKSGHALEHSNPVKIKEIFIEQDGEFKWLNNVY